MAKLEVTEAQLLKAEMFDGVSLEVLHQKYGLSFSTLNNIKAGKQYDYVPWPDGTTGKMQKMQRNKLREERKYNSRVNNNMERLYGGGNDSLLIAQYGWNAEDERKLIENTGMTSAEWIADYKRRKEEEITRMNDELAERERKNTEAFYALPEKQRQKILAKNSRPDRNVPIDQADPEGFEYKYDWDEILELEPENLLVQMAEGENNEAMRQAIRGIFHPENKMSTPMNRGKPQTAKLVLEVTKKIEHFWRMNPDRAPAQGGNANQDDLGKLQAGAPSPIDGRS